jgi:hypothetical protein
VNELDCARVVTKHNELHALLKAQHVGKPAQPDALADLLG